MNQVPFNLVAFNNGGKQRIKEVGYNACYFGGAARTSCPYGEDDAQMRQAWIEGWQEADADCWASANAA